MSNTISGMISAFAAAQSPESTQTSTIAMMRCWKRAGMEETTEEKISPKVMIGARSG